MALLISLPFLVIAVCLLCAMIYSLLYERNKPLLLKEKYRKKHCKEMLKNEQSNSIYCR